MTGVLIVDDDFMVARVHRGYVDRVPGFTVVGEAHTGAGALAAVDELRPNLVLLDVYLPDMSGLEVLAELRSGRHAAVDVIAVTAARDVASIRSAMQGGVLHYLIKPFSYPALRDRLERYTEVSRALPARGPIRQDDVDRAFGVARSAPTPTLPKGLSRPTCDLVLTLLRNSGEELSAAEVAERCGLSRVSARRYLGHLAASGVLTLRLRYGSGRPEHRYRCS